MELGLIKLVHVGRLLPIEQALAGLKGVVPAKPKVEAAPEQPPCSTAAEHQANRTRACQNRTSPTAPVASGDLRFRLLADLNAKSMTFIAECRAAFRNSGKRPEIEITTSKDYALALKSGDLRRRWSAAGTASANYAKFGEVAARCG